MSTDTAVPTVEQQPAPTPPHVNSEALGRILLGRWADERLASRAVVAQARFQGMPGLPMAEHRARVLDQLRGLSDSRVVLRAFPKEFGGEWNHGGNIAQFQELVLGDPSMQIKAGVQWGLFGAAVLFLGTARHHEQWLRPIMSLELPGVYAMTETGHGSDVAAVGTTATYDEASEEWIIHTPFRAAWKDYLGNAALHGRAAVVFAKLITKGVDHGVHAFFVPIRDEAGAFLPGVGGEDDGLKGGLNGIDNGRLHFDQVRVPRENLLNRYGDVAADGTYSSPIASPGRRFFTMLGTLVQGRVSLDGSATVAAKAALTIAIRYAEERRQFAGPGGGETVLLDYGRHQRRLLTRLAETYAMSFAGERMLEKFDRVFSGEHDSDDERADLETLAAALKPLSTWSALDILQESREALGGAGFLAENRVAQLRADLDVYVTFEGDNTVLLQLVGKRLLSDYAARFKGAGRADLAQYVAGQVGQAAVNRSGLRSLAQRVRDFGSTARSVGFVRDEDSQRQLLTDRVHAMIADVAAKLRPGTRLDAEAAAELFNRHQHELIEASIAHGELLRWEAFADALHDVDDAGTRVVLGWLRDLFGLTVIERHLDWYLINGRLSPDRATAVTEYIDGRLLPRIRPHALALTDAFGFAPEHLRAAVATGAEAARQEEARAYYDAGRAAGTLPTPEPKPQRG